MTKQKIQKLLIFSSLLAIGGCSYGDAFLRHSSAPLQGAPLTKPYDDTGRPSETTVNELGFSVGWCNPPTMRVCFESSLAYDFSAGKFGGRAGGPVYYTGTIKIRLFGHE